MRGLGRGVGGVAQLSRVTGTLHGNTRLTPDTYIPVESSPLCVAVVATTTQAGVFWLFRTVVSIRSRTSEKPRESTKPREKPQEKPLSPWRTLKSHSPLGMHMKRARQRGEPCPSVDRLPALVCLWRATQLFLVAVICLVCCEDHLCPNQRIG